MKIDIGKLSYDPVRYCFETGLPSSEKNPDKTYLRIKPIPLSETQFIVKDGGLIFTGEERCRMFKEALVGWEGVVGADGKPLPCTDDVKQKIFDFQIGGISNFVLTITDQFNQEKVDDEKNS